MPNLFDCPNSQCTYKFDADILPAAAMVTCPLCKTKFPYRRPVPKTEADEHAEQFEMGPRVVSVQQEKGISSFLTILMWGGCLLLIGGGLVGAYFLWMNKSYNKASGEAFEEARLNFKVDRFGAEWEQELNAQKGLEANIFARKRKEPTGWVAMFAQDFGDHNPRVGEMRSRMLSRLKTYGRNITAVDLPDQTWLGQPALAYQFQGDIEDTPVHGECLTVVHKGIGYIYYLWAPDTEWDNARDELIKTRNKVQLLNNRSKWVEKKSNIVTFTTDEIAYSVEDPDGKWKQAYTPEEGKSAGPNDYLVNPKDVDPQATMAFRLVFQPKAGSDARQRTAEAKAVVVELPKATKGMADVQAHVIAQAKKEYASDMPPDLKLEPLEKSPGGVDLPTDGPEMARFLLRDPFDRDNKEVFILSTRKIGDKTVAVIARTKERDTPYVEEWMVHLAASLKEK
jgi:hypothetical protein